MNLIIQFFSSLIPTLIAGAILLVLLPLALFLVLILFASEFLSLRSNFLVLLLLALRLSDIDLLPLSPVIFQSVRLVIIFLASCILHATTASEFLLSSAAIYGPVVVSFSEPLSRSIIVSSSMFLFGSIVVSSSMFLFRSIVVSSLSFALQAWIVTRRMPVRWLDVAAGPGGGLLFVHCLGSFLLSISILKCHGLIVGGRQLLGHL